jgi:hypothetical protein
MHVLKPVGKRMHYAPPVLPTLYPRHSPLHDSRQRKQPLTLPAPSLPRQKRCIECAPAHPVKAQPLTEPAVSPLMTCWLSIKYKISVGKTARQTAANVGPQSIWPYCPLKFNNPT